MQYKFHVLIFAVDTKMTTKCPWFSLKTPDVKEQPKIVFEDADVSFTFETVKDLGILFVSSLSCTPHLEKRIYDAYGRFINLKRSLPKLISSQQKALACQTYIQPFPMDGLPIKTIIRSNSYRRILSSVLASKSQGR